MENVREVMTISFDHFISTKINLLRSEFMNAIFLPLLPPGEPGWPTEWGIFCTTFPGAT